jgi:hypothetical protein
MRRILLIALAVASLGGCATVTRGTTNNVQIVSEPNGASARTSFGHQCTTPCTLSVSRKDEFSVVVSAPGYEEQRVDVKTKLAGTGAAGFAGNIVAGGVVGMVVDASTGATLEHSPNPITVKLRPLAAAAAPAVRMPAERRAKPKAPAPQAEPAPVS